MVITPAWRFLLHLVQSPADCSLGYCDDRTGSGLSSLVHLGSRESSWACWASLAGENLQQPGDSLYGEICLTQCLLSDSPVTHLLPTWQRLLKPFTACFWFLHLLCTIRNEMPPRAGWDNMFLSPDFASAGFTPAEARRRKLWDCHHCAPCGMQRSHWPAEGRGTDWDAKGSRHDIRPTSSAKCPRPGWVADRPCNADNQHLRAQVRGQTEPGNQLGWEWCNFTSLKSQDGAGVHELFSSAREPKCSVCSAATALTLLLTAISRLSSIPFTPSVFLAQYNFDHKALEKQDFEPNSDLTYSGIIQE